MNQQNRDDEQDGSARNPESPSVVEADADNKKKAPRRHADDSDHKKSFRRSWRSASPLTKVTLFLTGLIAIATVLYMIFAGWQLYEIHSGAEDTHKLAQAARDTADATREQLRVIQEQLKAIQEQAGTMREQSGTMRDTLAETQKMVSAAETQAKASLAQAETAKQSVGFAASSAKAAERSARASEQAFRVGERAYISVESMFMVPLDASEIPTITVVFRNGGRLPASQLYFARRFYLAYYHPMRSDAIKSPLDIIGGDWKGKQSSVGADLLPAGETKKVIFSASRTLTEGEISKINSGELKFSVELAVFYSDGLGEFQMFNQCSVFNPARNEFEECY